MAEMKEVFISYHEKSAGEYVTKLANRLEGAGISCWYAKRDLPSGGDFADYIPPQLYGCKVFLLILNEGANHSRHVENEVGLAFRRYNKGEKIDILPYQVERCDFAHWLDYYLIHIQIQSAEIMDMGALVTEVSHRLGRTPVKYGNCGLNVDWRFRDSVLTISTGRYGMGSAMGNFYFQNVPQCVNTPWWSEHEKIKSIVIETGITNIGQYAFYGCSSLNNVNIPNSVTSIGFKAFGDCNSLTSVNIPDSVSDIGDAAFYGCSSLTNLNIPDSVENIGNTAFLGCSSLTSVHIPDSVTSIGTGIFWGCSSLINVHIPDSVNSIGNHAFLDCSSLTNVNFPYSIKYIGYGAFHNCPNLQRVIVPMYTRIVTSAFDPHTQIIRPPR